MAKKVAHREHWEPQHVVDAPSVKRYRCSTCSRNVNTLAPGAPFCFKCSSYMVLDTTIDSSKVREIKNRKLVGEEDVSNLKKGREGRFEDGMVPVGVSGLVYPRSGSKFPLQLLANMDKSAFKRYMVILKWGDMRVMTTIGEIGGAFRPFIPIQNIGQMTVRDEFGNDTVRKATATSRAGSSLTTKIGPISVKGNQGPKLYKEGMVTFTHGRKTSVFKMSDIAMVLSGAL